MTTTASGLTLVANVASESEPGKRYPVATDGAVLSCPCPGWTRRIHLPDCRAVTHGLSCNCTHAIGNRSIRTCRHVRAVQVQVQAAGGLRQVLRLLARGVDVQLGDVPAAPQMPEWFRLLENEIRQMTFNHTGGETRARYVGAIDEALRRLRTGSAPVVQEAPARPDWLGGGRAILLRD